MPPATSIPNWPSAMLLRNEAAGDQPTMEQAGAASVCLARGEYAEYCARHDAWHGDVMSIPHVLLALLAEGPKYGLQLREEFEAGTGEVWPLNVGQVYTTLQRLERDGLVESEGDGPDGAQKGVLITPGRLRGPTRRA